MNALIYSNSMHDLCPYCHTSHTIKARIYLYIWMNYFGLQFMCIQLINKGININDTFHGMMAVRVLTK